MLHFKYKSVALSLNVERKGKGPVRPARFAHEKKNILVSHEGLAIDVCRSLKVFVIINIFNCNRTNTNQYPMYVSGFCPSDKTK